MRVGAGLCCDQSFGKEKEAVSYTHLNRGTGANGTGYVRGADGKPIDAPAIIVTTEQKQASIAADYESQISELKDALATATLAGDELLIAELKSEYADVKSEYEAALKEDVYKRQAAHTTFKVTLSAVREKETIIPKGTRVSTQDNIAFATDTALIIKAGEQVGMVAATCTQTGTVGNDFRDVYKRQPPYSYHSCTTPLAKMVCTISCTTPFVPFRKCKRIEFLTRDRRVSSGRPLS